MANPIQDLIALALEGERCTYHEVIPEEFGPETSRWLLLRSCLEVLAARHPLLTVELTGSLDALRKFDLVPARAVGVGDTMVGVRFGRTDRLGAVRVQFSRAAFVGRRQAAREPAEAGRD